MDHTPGTPNEGISAALETWIGSLRDETAGLGPGILGDWIAVVCMVDVVDGVPTSQYYVALKDGSMLPHVARGLMVQGLDELEARMENGNELD